jgi:hypothetical protein
MKGGIMKFIFPQNYDFNTKLFGLIDYSTAIFNAIWTGLVIVIVNLIFKDLNIKIFLCIILAFPVLLFSVIGINGENVLYVFSYILKYITRQKVFLYEKDN